MSSMNKFLAGTLLQVLMDDGNIVTCSRDVALIVYLTKDWKEEYGGLLVDLEAQGGSKTYVPEVSMRCHLHLGM